jgi:hypothetical protein
MGKVFIVGTYDWRWVHLHFAPFVRWVKLEINYLVDLKKLVTMVDI